MRKAKTPGKSTWRPASWPLKSSERLFPARRETKLARSLMFPSMKMGNLTGYG
jgi:hypothetical protein